MVNFLWHAHISSSWLPEFLQEKVCLKMGFKKLCSLCLQTQLSSGRFLELSEALVCAWEKPLTTCNSCQCLLSSLSHCLRECVCLWFSHPGTTNTAPLLAPDAWNPPKCHYPIVGTEETCDYRHLRPLWELFSWNQRFSCFQDLKTETSGNFECVA